MGMLRYLRSVVSLRALNLRPLWGSISGGIFEGEGGEEMDVPIDKLGTGGAFHGEGRHEADGGELFLDSLGLLGAGDCGGIWEWGWVSLGLLLDMRVGIAYRSLVGSISEALFVRT